MSSDPVLDPLKPADARKLMREIMVSGDFEFSSHAIDEMRKDGLAVADCINVLRGGVVEPPEYTSGQWRYRVSTQRICLVVAFLSVDELWVITVWRIR